MTDGRRRRRIAEGDGDGDRRRRRRRIAEEMEQDTAERNQPVSKSNIDPNDLLPTGCLLFNLGLSDCHQGGFQKGKMANIIGDSSSGKTFLGLSCFAEAAQLESFDEYTFINDDAESACEFNIPKLFGKKTASRIEPPSRDGEGNPVHSDTVQDLWDHLNDLLDEEKPFIYLMDSMDSLDEISEKEHYESNRKARRAGKEETGSYGTKKAKVIGEMLRDIIPKLRKTGSILLIISQTRDNINPISFAKKTRSGGKALKFYATHEVWLANAGQIKRKEQIIGYYTNAKVTKNKLTGKHRVVKFPIFYDYGIDSLRGSIEFCMETSYWNKKRQTIIAEDLGLECTLPKMISVIEEGGLEEGLAEAVQKAWDIREDDLKLNRKSKYE